MEERELLIKEIKEQVLSELKKDYFLVTNIYKNDSEKHDPSHFLLTATEIISNHFKISVNDLSKGQKRKFIDPRRMIFLLCRDVCFPKISYPEIGKAFDKKHCSIIFAYKKAHDLLQVDKKFKSEYEKIKQMVELKLEIKHETEM